MADQLKEDDEAEDLEAPAKVEEPAKVEAKEDEGETIVLEADGEDARLDVDAQGETPDDRQTRRREEKRQRRDRQHQARAAKDAEINNLRAENESLNNRVNGIAQHLTQRGAAELDGRIYAARSRAKEATEIMAQAIKVGDERAVVEAMEIRDNARDEFRALEMHRQNSTRAAAAPREAPAPDPQVQRRARDFLADHPWYDPKGADQDSKVILAIDAQVTAEGFDPRSDKYWDELEDRAEKMLPKRFSNGNGAARPAAQQRGPQLGNERTGESQGGRKTVFVSAARRAAMVEAGLWDDPVKRTKVLKDYARLDREQGARQ